MVVSFSKPFESGARRGFFLKQAQLHKICSCGFAFAQLRCFFCRTLQIRRRGRKLYNAFGRRQRVLFLAKFFKANQRRLVRLQGLPLVFLHQQVGVIKGLQRRRRSDLGQFFIGNDARRVV